MIRHNLGYKLIAIGVALALWAYVNAERFPQSRKTISVPIETRNLARGYVADIAASRASVTINGLKTTVDSLRKGDVSAWVDLGGFRGDKRVAALRLTVNANVSEDSNDLEVSSISPAAVKVRLEALGAKRLPIEVKFPASAPLGYTYSNPVVVPAGVSVSGKSTAVMRVQRIVLILPNQVPDSAIDDYFPVTPLDATGEVVGEVNLRPDKVRLKMELVEVPATKAVVVSPTVIGEPRFPAKVDRVSVTPASVALEGKPSALVGVSTVGTEKVSIDGAESTVTRDVNLRIPPGVRIVDRGKVRVTVHIASPE